MGFRFDYSLVLSEFDSILKATHLPTLWCHWSCVFWFSYFQNYPDLPAPYLEFFATDHRLESIFPSLVKWKASFASLATCLLGSSGHLGPHGRQYFGGQGIHPLQLSDGLGLLQSKRWQSHHRSLGAFHRAPLAATDWLCASLAASHLSFSDNVQDVN